MSEDTVEQKLSEESIVAPKPSDVRRSGKFNYAARKAHGRPGYQPPAVRRITAAQQQYAERVRQNKLAALELKAESKMDDAEEVDDDAIDIIVNESFADEDSDLEEKKVDDVPVLEMEPDVEEEPVEEKPEENQPEDTPAAETPVAEDEELKKEDEPLAVETEEPTEKKSAVPAEPRSPRAYHRPHTNLTVTAGDEPSMASTQPKNDEEEEEEEDEDDDEEDEEMSQTSRGNYKRRRRLRRKRRDYRSSGRSSKGDRPRSLGANQIGHAVSKAFDNLLGYTETMDDDQSFYSKGTAMMDDWQEAILQTLGCAVPDPRSTMKGANTFDDNTTVDSNRTGDETAYSSVKHRRTKSDVSGSIFSGIDGSVFANVLSFDTTDELADFSKDKKAKEESAKANYKVPENYDATPPYVPKEKKEDLYSEDLYAKDTETVNLLEEGDSMVENGVKDLLNVARTAVDGAIEFLLAPTQSEESEKAAPAVAPAESASLLGTLSNVTEPLQVITENDAESPLRKPTESPADKEAFESFEKNAFEAAELTNEAEGSKSESVPVSDPGDVIIQESASDASVFDGIENKESMQSQHGDLLPPVEAGEEQDESSPVEAKPSEDLDKTEEEPASNTATDPAVIVAPTTTEANTESIEVDREEISEPAPELPVEVSSEPIVSEEQETKADVAPASPPVVEKTEVTESKEAAVTTPERKKKKKGFFKKMFSRSKKDKKGKKQSSAPLASMTESTPQEKIEVPKEVAPVTPAPNSGGAVESEGVTLEQPDPPENDTQESSELPPCPTTPVRGPESVPNTPKTSNLVSEDRTITKPASGTNLADLPGIDEAKSFREDPPASPPASSDGFGHVAGFEALEAMSNSQDISFGSFNLDLEEDDTWESFGDNSNDVGHAAFKQKLFSNANGASPQKVSDFPVY